MGGHQDGLEILALAVVPAHVLMATGFTAKPRLFFLMKQWYISQKYRQTQ